MWPFLLFMSLLFPLVSFLVNRDITNNLPYTQVEFDRFPLESRSCNTFRSQQLFCQKNLIIKDKGTVLFEGKANMESLSGKKMELPDEGGEVPRNIPKSEGALTSEQLKQREGLRVWEQSLVSALPPDDRLEEFYDQFCLPDGRSMKVKIFRRKESSTLEGRPLIILFHGGGYFAGSIEMCTRPGRDFALHFDAVVISASYRQCPEHPFPTPVLDAIHTVRYLACHADRWGADVGTGLVVGGLSAGASAAAIVALHMIDEGVKLTGTYLCLPWLLMEEIVPSQYRHLWTSHKDNPGAEDLHRLVSSIKMDVHSPYFSPFNHDTASCAKVLPPTYIQVGEKDVLRDDGVVYVEVLRRAGVPVKVDCVEGVGHATFSIWPSPEELENRCTDGMGWLLGRKRMI